jgi:hypothetical protein
MVCGIYHASNNFVRAFHYQFQNLSHQLELVKKLIRSACGINGILPFIHAPHGKCLLTNDQDSTAIIAGKWSSMWHTILLNT